MNWNLVGSIYGRSSIKMLISSRSINKHGRHRKFMFMIVCFLKKKKKICGKRVNSNLNIDIYFSIIQLKWICINKCDWDTHPKPYIFMIRVTRQIKCLITQAPEVIPHPLPEVNFLMVEIPTPKPYIFMIRVIRQIKYLIAQAPGVIPHPLPEVNFLMVEIPPLSHIYLWSGWIDKWNASRVEPWVIPISYRKVFL